jgi:hypothetical protein
MNVDIMNACGFREEVSLVANGKCPICKEDINIESFRNTLSLKEFRISGMCQKCQDGIFGED